MYELQEILLALSSEVDELQYGTQRLSICSILGRVRQDIDGLHERTACTIPHTIMDLLTYGFRGFFGSREWSSIDLQIELLEDVSFYFRIGHTYRSESLMGTSWYSSVLSITLCYLMSLEYDHISESSDSPYFESCFIDAFHEHPLCISTDSYITELVIEFLYLVGECNEFFPSFSVWCVPIDTVVCHGFLLSY